MVKDDAEKMAAKFAVYVATITITKASVPRRRSFAGADGHS